MKKFTKLLKDKKWIWTAGGISCLVAAASLFAVGRDVGADAVSLGGTEVNLTLNNGVYEIDNYEELKALGNATVEETSGGKFKLVSDIVAANITSVSTGTFAGEFDGNGHVISIENIDITDTTANQATGLIFGTVTGSVKDLIVDVQDTDPSYTKELNGSIVPDGEMTEEIVGNPAEPLQNSSDMEALADSKEIDGQLYKYHIVEENRVQINKYKDGAVSEAYFGVVCGDNQGTIQHVYVKGDYEFEFTSTGEMVSGYDTVKKYGTKEFTYYYKQSTEESILDPEDKELNIGVKLYGEDSKSNTVNGLTTTVTYQKAVEKETEEGLETKVSFEVKVENTGDVELQNVSVTLGDNTKQIGTLGKEGSSLEVFEVNAIGDSFQTNVAAYAQIVTVAEGENENNIQDVICNVEDIQVVLFEQEDSVVTDTFKNKLEATLVVDKEIKCGNSNKFTYTLELKNKNENSSDSLKDIVVTTDFTDWSLINATDNVIWGSEKQIIPAGEKVVLTKEVSRTVDEETKVDIYVEAVKIVASLHTTTTVYKYVSDMDVIGEFVADSSEEVKGNAISSGGKLYAGGIAGTSSGVISVIKQSMDLAGSGDRLVLGGIAGKADGATWSTLYMLGKVNGTDSSYVGEGTMTINDSYTAELTTAPNNNWAEFKKPELDADGNISEQSGVDMSWLVVDGAFDYTEPDDAGNITANLKNTKTSKNISYTFAYRGRKSLSETKVENDYLSDTNVIELGNSGYYTLLGAYATDGYYHYQTTIDTDPERLYPYDSDGWDLEIIRANPVDDQMELEFSKAITGTMNFHINDKITIPYEGVGSQLQKATVSAGVVLLPFDLENVEYHMVPEVKGHIYPPLISESYSEKLKTPIEKPSVTAYDFYNSVGNLQNYKAFAMGDSYVAGRDMMITPQGEESKNYTIRYMYSATAPVSDEWEDSRYLKNSTTFEALFESEAREYVDSAVIPTELLGTQEQVSDIYLYVEISRKNYASQIYYYGPFSIEKEDELSMKTESSDGYTVLNGDVVMIEGDVGQNTKIQYFVSKEATSDYSVVNWKDYTPSGIVMNQQMGGHIYARIEYSIVENAFGIAIKYSPVFSFQCTFGGVCDAPKVTPYTGIASGDTEIDQSVATKISSSTTIYLSSRTEKAHIFYIESDTKTTIELGRVTFIPKDDLADGEVIEGVKYFNVGGRWYSTRNTEVKRFEESVHLLNGTNQSVLRYISAVALSEGYEKSESLCFVYDIKAAQPVEAPEAAIATRYTPGGDALETATVKMGSNITFYSVTPGAKLYYSVGSSTAVPTEPVPKDGVTVAGEYNGTFIVRVQAKLEGMLDSEIITFVYRIDEQDRVNTPTATPGTTADVPTTVLPGNKILLSTTTKEAEIYYTVDGTSPVVTEKEDGTFVAGNESTMLYDSTVGVEMPKDGSGYFTITAIAVKSGLSQSLEAHFTYSYPEAVLAPYANLDSGKVELNAKVYLKNLTEGANIYYNIAYGSQTPDDPTLSSSVFSDEYPFTITQKTTIKALAAKNGVKSIVVTFTFDPMAQLKAPNASIDSGSVVAPGTVLGLTAEKGATIYYTMDGSDPTDSTNTAVMAGNSLVLNGEPGGQITIKAYAVAEDKSNSEVATFTYQFSQNAGGVTASIPTGTTVSNGTKVNLISDVTEGDIYYTIDGSSPVSNGKKGTTVEISGTPGTTFTIKAVVIVDGKPGTIATFIYKIQDRPDAPTASPAGGVLTVATRVSLSAGTEKIYYTTDGTEPTKSSALYTEPILINKATILKAIAVSEEGVESEVATFVYTAAAKAAKVTSSKPDGSVLEPGDKIQLHSSTAGVTIYYSTNGTEPTLDNLDNMLIYDGESIEINRSVTIQAVAYKADLRMSEVAIWNYIVEKIPAVEQKKAEAEKLAEEGLRDTDASGLNRTNEKEEDDKITKIVREKEYQTEIIYSSEAFNGKIVLETIEKDDNPYTIKKAKGIYGDDKTILETYQVKVKSNSSSVQPRDVVEVGFKIPKGYEDAALSVALVKEDDNLTTLETRREDNMLYVKTKKLGNYIIIGPERTAMSKNKFSYLPILEAVAGITLAGGAVFYGIEKYKKSKKK